MRFGGGSSTTETTDLTVQELDGTPTGSGINTISFNSAFDSNIVYINGTEAIIGAPDPPPAFNTTSLLLNGATQYTGRLSQNNINYEGLAGDSVNYIQNDSIFSLTSQTDSNFGDKGVLQVIINGEKAAAISLVTNFNELNRNGSQTLSEYDTDYDDGTNLYPCENGICDFIGTYAGSGSLQIIKVAWYNDFGLWQTWQARINITGELRKGYSEIYLEHVNISGEANQTSNTFKYFHDNDSGTNPSVNSPTVSINTPSYNYLSGIQYYGTGSTYNISLIGDYCFNNVYHNSEAPIVLTNWPGLSDTPIIYDNASVSGVTDPPTIGDTMNVNNFSITQGANAFSSDARITAYPRDPYGNYTSVQSASGGWLVNSYTAASDDLHEYFRDENYRLLWDETTNDHDTIPAAKTGNWDSEQSLLTYYSGNKHLQFFNRQLYYPVTDFSTGYKPTGNPDYSSFTGITAPSFSNFTGNVGAFCRAFYDDGAEHTNGILYIGGITNSHLENGDIEIFIKVPGKTGWTTLNVDYNFSIYTGADGDGCRTNKTTYDGPDFEFTLGSNVTDATTNYGLVVLIIMDSSSPNIVNNLYISNW